MCTKKSDVVDNSCDTMNETDGTELPVGSQDERGDDQPIRKKGFLRRFIWPVLKYPGYAAFLVGAVILIIMGLEKLAELSLKRTYLSSVYPNDFSMVLKDYTYPVSHYDYDFVPGVCLEYNTAKGNRYEHANNAGFREPRDISLKKPDDEYRIFLTGGSTAFGLGSVGEAAQVTGWYALEYRETISHYLEKILNATAPLDGKTIRVYNTAVWGYAYQHHIGRYMAKLRRYNPDLVISLDGANEIPMVCKIDNDWRYFREAQFNGVLRQIFSYDFQGLSSYLTLWLKNNTYLMTYWWRGRDLFQELHTEAAYHEGANPGARAPVDPTTLPQEDVRAQVEDHAATVVRMVENYHSILKNDGVPHIFVLQPWFYMSQKPKEKTEQKLAELTGHEYYYGVSSEFAYQVFLNAVVESAKEKDYFVVDFSRYFDDVTQWVFTDWCHLTAGANYLLAKELANRIKKSVFQQALTSGDSIGYGNKDSFFYELAATATVAYAPEADASANKPENMLTGYPKETLYSSRAVPEGERLEVVLELTEARLVSRLRLVWADSESVPEDWIVDTSIDGTTWNAWVKGDKDRIDTYSRWPGYEYFAAEPVVARYVRYRPQKTGPRTIRLRLFSLQR